MIEILLIVIVLIGIGNIWLNIHNGKSNNLAELKGNFDVLDKSVQKVESSLKDEFSRNRDETYKQSKEQREELSSIVKNFGESISNRLSEIAVSQKSQLDGFSTQLQTLIKTNEDKFDKLIMTNNQNLKDFQQQNDLSYKEFKTELSTFLNNVSTTAEKMNQNVDSKLKELLEGLNQNAKDSREELGKSLKSFEDQSTKNVKDSNDVIKEKFDGLLTDQKELNSSIEIKLDKIRNTVEDKLKSIQDENSKKLDEMRATVDEKLQSTLEKRLGDSFKQVSDQLEQVHKGLGEMQILATGVGDLKKVLSGVKTRGVLGELQLANILDQILTPDQYSKNVRTKNNSNDMVEFGVKLPGREDKGKIVWLPLDSKFPTEDYQALLNAYEIGDVLTIDEKSKALCNRIKSCAKEIRDKYIDPPNTTDFGILFLPFEGLYAEVLRNVGLFETLQRDYKITITGPTTMAALLNSLQMGFRTLAIEKRSSEVWEILSSVKTEFGHFGEILKKTHKKLQEASNVIEQAGKKSRTIERKLRDVQVLPMGNSVQLLGVELNNNEEEKIEDKADENPE